MKRYQIADYLPADWRAAIVKARYGEPGRSHKQRLADGVYCPFGVPYRDGLVEYYHNPSAPDGEVIASALLRRLEEDGDPRALRAVEDGEATAFLALLAAAAQEFVNDWDDGVIAPGDLGRALAAPERTP